MGVTEIACMHNMSYLVVSMIKCSVSYGSYGCEHYHINCQITQNASKVFIALNKEVDRHAIH